MDSRDRSHDRLDGGVAAGAATATIDAPCGEFRDLALQIRAAGLLNRRPGYYSLKIALTVGAYAAGWAALFLLGDTWATIGVAAYLGFVFTQLGFLGHDAGHHQVFKGRGANTALGLAVGNALIGVSFGWWVPKHSAHHAHPNELGLDPDLGEGLPGYAPSGETQGGAVSRFFAKWQAWTFFPLMLLRSLGLHISGIQRLVRTRDRRAAMEAAILTVHAGLFLAAVLIVLSPLRALVFIVVLQAVFSVYLGCSFAPNHKGMPIVERGSEMSFLRRQVITARNIHGGRFTNFMLGGLNYQIEHHLFPTMPRPNLSRAQRIIRPFCLDSDLTYEEDSIVGSFRRALVHLSEMATPPALATSAT